MDWLQDPGQVVCASVFSPRNEENDIICLMKLLKGLHESIPIHHIKQHLANSKHNFEWNLRNVTYKRDRAPAGTRVREWSTYGTKSKGMLTRRVVYLHCLEFWARHSPHSNPGPFLSSKRGKSPFGQDSVNLGPCITSSLWPWFPAVANLGLPHCLLVASRSFPSPT